MAQNQELLRAYLMVGSDQLKRETSQERLKRRLEGGLADFNIDEFELSSELDAATLLASLQTMPFGSDFRLVIVHVGPRPPKVLTEALVTYLQNPNPSCVLAVDAETLAKNTRLYKAIAACGPKAIIDCSAKKRWQLPEYVITLARHYGSSMDERAAKELVDRAGESTVMLNNQVKNLVELLNHPQQLSFADVERHVARIADVSPWQLLDAICERNITKALSLYATMADPPYVMLQAQLCARIRELMCAKSLDKRGSTYRLADELGKQDWQIKNHARWAAAFSEQELVQALRALATLERRLKGTGDNDLAFIECVRAICASQA